MSKEEGNLTIGDQQEGASNSASPSVSPSPSSPPQPRETQEKINILMVDDHAENLLALEAILEGLGQNLIRASSGREALRALLEREFAVILLDVQMPGMDGFETAELIRDRDKLQHTPIIFLTALNTSENNVSRGYSLGAVDYMFKPFAPDVLRAKVSVFIDLYRKNQEVRRQAELLKQTNRELAKTNKAMGGLYKELELRSLELFKERDFIDAVLQTAGSLVMVRDEHGAIERFNRSCEQLSGYSAKEVRGMSGWDLIHPDQRLEARAAFEKVLRGEYPVHIEYDWVSKNGLTHSISWTHTALTDDDGVVTHVISSGIDITAWNQAQEEQRRLNEELKVRSLELHNERDFIDVVLQTAGSLVFVRDSHGVVERFNRSCEKTVGIPAEEMIGQTIWEKIVHPDDAEAARQAFMRVLQGEYPLTLEYRWINADGQARLISWTHTAIKDTSGQVIHVVSSGIDVTERHQAEEELKLLNEELERRVLVRTAQLQTVNSELATEIQERKRAEEEVRTYMTELQKAKDVAENANKTKDQFLAVLSHELRTPLTPVLAIVQMLEEDPEVSDDMKLWVQTIHRNVELEARLIDDLLDLTRIANGKLRLNCDRVNAHALLENVVQICQADIHAKELKLNVKYEAPNPKVMADSARLQQIFWNLLKNAVKFTPAGGTIEIKTSNNDDLSDPGFLVEFTDTGIGIDREVLPKIFDAFEQGDKNVTRQFGGLGLGLAITKALVDAHVGKIWVESEGKNSGARFSVLLPLAKENNEENGKQNLPTSSASSSNGRSTTAKLKNGSTKSTADLKKNGKARDVSKTRILIVEDNLDTSIAMRHLLERRGYAVVVANNITDALEAAGKHDFHVVISDIGLPDGNGLDLIRKLKTDRPIHGIAMSGFGMDEDIRRSLEAGFETHLTKPVDFEQLCSAVKALVSEEATA